MYLKSNSKQCEINERKKIVAVASKRDTHFINGRWWLMKFSLLEFDIISKSWWLNKYDILKAADAIVEYINCVTVLFGCCARSCAMCVISFPHRWQMRGCEATATTIANVIWNIYKWVRSIHGACVWCGNACISCIPELNWFMHSNQSIFFKLYFSHRSYTRVTLLFRSEIRIWWMYDA